MNDFNIIFEELIGLVIKVERAKKKKSIDWCFQQLALCFVVLQRLFLLLFVFQPYLTYLTKTSYPFLWR